MEKNKGIKKKKRDFTKMKTPHIYVIIFGVVLFSWLLTFLVPAGKFSTEEIEYDDGNGGISTRTVLRQDSFRYAHPLDQAFVFEQLEALQNNPTEMEALEVPEEGLEEVLAAGEQALTQEELDEVSLTDDVLYEMYGMEIYDTSKKLHRTARVWGTDDTGGFGFLNFEV